MLLLSSHLYVYEATKKNILHQIVETDLWEIGELKSQMLNQLWIKCGKNGTVFSLTGQGGNKGFGQEEIKAPICDKSPIG